MDEYVSSQVLENSTPFLSPISLTSENDFRTLEPELDFILTFKSHPELWNHSNFHYSNKYKRRGALEKLLPILKKMKPFASIEDVRKKINSIRSNHRREVRKIVTSKRLSSKEYVPKVWYFPYLHFLREGQSPFHQHQAEPEIDERSLGRSIFLDISKISRTLLPKVDEKKIGDLSLDYQYKSCNKPYLVQSAFNPIVREWADTLEKLDPTQCLYAKKAINDILFEAELGNLHKNSVKINESYLKNPCTLAP